MPWKTDDNKVIERIKRSIRGDRISHAYIFEGDSNTDKSAFVKDFIKAVLCKENPGDGCGKCAICRKVDHDNHEDIQYIYGSEGTGRVKNEAISVMQERLRVMPAVDRNIAVIYDADKMTTRAQNRILKTLEEPPGNSLIILLAENISGLLPTVLSRCIYFRIPEGLYTFDLPQDEDGNYSDIEKTVDMIISGELFYSIKPHIDQISKDLKTSLRFLDCFEVRLGKLVTDRRYSDRYSPEMIYSAVSDVEEARRDINSDASRGYVLKKLVLKTGR